MTGKELEMNFTLRGWHALIVAPIILIAAFIYFQSGRVALKQEAQETIRLQLQGIYASQILEGAAEGDGDDDLADMASRALKAVDAVGGVEFTSLTARGAGDEATVRVEIEVNGGPPPDGKSVRYFVFERLIGNTWQYKHESSALSYYLKLL